MVNRLDFLVIGVQKSATSWLYRCLRDHPEVCVPRKKNEFEYLGGDLYEAKGPEWYFSLLKDAGPTQRVGAVSVDYIFDVRSPQVVHRYAPNVKIIASLREPVDRSISAYQWGIRKGILPDVPPEEGFGAAVKRSDHWRNPKVTNMYDDLIMRGFYDDQLNRYFECFGPDQFLFVLYEDIKAKPLGVLRKIYEFLGVNPAFEPPSLNAKPKHNTNLRALMYLERCLKPTSRVTGKLMDLANRLLHRLSVEGRKPTLPDGLLEKLGDIYRPHVEGTHALIRKLPEGQQPFSANVLETWARK